MTTRRQMLGGTGALGATAMLVGNSRLGATPVQTPSPKAGPKAPDLIPAEALQQLRNGNEAFLRGEQPSVEGNARLRLRLATGQAPFAAYVTCSDSRVPPELLFGRGLGELFIIRNAGNTVDTVALGSIEYAVAILETPLVVVMGHESCGAVAAAARVVTENATFPGSIGPMVESIIPAVLQAQSEEGDLVDNAVRANVRRVVRQLREQTDPIMLDPQREGKLWVVGAYYELGSGKVNFFDLPN